MEGKIPFWKKMDGGRIIWEIQRETKSMIQKEIDAKLFVYNSTIP